MTLPRINVCIVQPSGYIHSMAFLEAARYLAALARKCGHAAEISKNALKPNHLNIVLGAHLLEAGTEVPPGSVIFNTEQLVETSAWFNSPMFRELLQHHPVWDYSRKNLEMLPHQRGAEVPFLYCEGASPIRPAPAKDIDILFYGHINDRRRKILEDLRNAGVDWYYLGGIYGPERDDIVARSRAILNLHYYDAQIFEQIRCFHPLSNGIPVISEDYPRDTCPPGYEDALFLPAGRDFVAFVKETLADRDAFDRAAAQKLAHFRSLDPLPAFREALAAAVEHYAQATASRPSPLPRKINLGSGKDYRPGYLNIDVNPKVGADLEIDLSQPLELPIRVNSRTWGEITLQPDMFDEILAMDVLEHVPDLAPLMTQCLQLLRPGGRFVIQVPYDLSLGAWQDPTHIRAFNENSWLYYTDWFWYMGWLEARFDCEKLVYNVSKLGEALGRTNPKGDEILRTPRAIDSMSVTLVKRATTMEEKQKVRAYAANFHLD